MDRQDERSALGGRRRGVRTIVDLFDWRQSPDPRAKTELVAVASKLGPMILSSAFAPLAVIGNFASVDFGKHDLITSIESIQYVGDKLGAVAHLYNPLIDDGFLIVSSEHSWSDSIALDESSSANLFFEAMKALAKAGIPFAISGSQRSADRVDGVTSMIIQKVPRTAIINNLRLKKVVRNRHGYLLSYYFQPDPAPSALAIQRFPRLQ